MKKNYTLHLGLMLAGFFALAGLTAQNSYTFTNCGATGSVGPTQAMVTASYAATNLAGLVTTTTNGIQTFTAPYSGNFRIEARGAQGGGGGGLGASMAGDFTLLQGEVIQILVGQMGDVGGSGPSGGSGGSFVVRAPYNVTTAILVIAGGGSGAGNYSFTPGQVTTSGANGGGAGGTNGSGGSGGTRGAGGGGFLTNGSPCTVNSAYANPGQAFVNGGLGGGATGNCSFIAGGGFGGGSSHGGNCINNGGAGGGFSGGGGSSNSTSGGGGSINTGSNQINAAGTNTGHGRVIITELCSVQIYATGATSSVNPVMCAGNSITLTTNAVSNYSWTNGSTASSIVVSPATNTVYGLSATSSLACSASAAMSITVSSGAPVISIANTNTSVCLGASASLSASGALTYTWVNAGVVNNQTFAPTSTAVYTVNGENGCGITSGTTAIVVAPISISVTASPTLVCEGYAATLTAVAPATSYTWTGSPSTASIAVVAPLANTIYTVSVSDGTCAGTETVALTTKTTPTISVVSTASQICQGDQVVITASGANTYTWQPGNMSGNSVTVSPATATLYVVMGENTVNCIAQNNQIVVVDPSPTINIVANKPIICTGGSVALTASGGSGYQWTGGPGAAGYTVTPTATTVYTVVGSHNTNTCTATKMHTVSVIVPNVTLPTNTNVCAGNSVTLYASGATSYIWNSIPSGSIAYYSIQPQLTSTVTLVATTSSMQTNCPVNHSLVVTVNPLPDITVSADFTAVCRGETNTLTASGAQTYSWSGNQTGASIVVTLTASTIFTVTGTDNNGCVNNILYLAKTNACTGIDEVTGTGSYFVVFPNPNNGSFTLRAGAAKDLIIVNELGQHIQTVRLTEEQGYSAEVKNLAAGIYFIMDQKSQNSNAQKVIVH